MTQERLPVSRANRIGLARKKAAHQIPPQKCPRCKADLSDPDVPERYAGFKAMFGIAVEVPVETHKAVWQCPKCSLLFGKHVVS